ncbi:hypothetical protein G1C96_1697 [Bifidobacterium sp. DSM 109958]|uniref:DUF8094 domain-containing protein n=1 Tax=Bifidobacterium moraviense TaxID=2675323 RepID=A0A7Y0F3B7_9BIFI|nr:hypothetical protein [Bifidobacterium sp. DSM 109958]NMN01114.1 hypothetical protein [Bifidobacterium sp. DSM 109958]
MIRNGRNANSARAMRVARVAAAALAVVSMSALAGCEGPVPKVTASASSGTTSNTRTPDLTVDQEAKIRASILDVINAANDSKDPSALQTRLTGPSLAVRTSQLTIAAATGALDKTANIPSDIEQTVIPTDTGWPRTLLSITTTTSDQQTQRLLVMEQTSAHANYKLWGVARLFSGAQLPKFAVPKIGTAMGTANDTGLVATPADAVAQYADLLTNGANSQYAASFADDAFRTDLAATVAKVQQGMEANKGTQTQTFAVEPDAIKVMRSSDGGDLVIAQINSEWTRQAGEGRQSLPASAGETALFAGGTATSTMKVTYVNVIALYVPLASSGAQIQAVGAERQPVKVEAL